MVDPSKWKKCNDSGFCVRQQAFADLIDTIQDDGELKNDLGWEASDFKFGGQTLPVVISASVKMKSEPALFNIEFLFSNDYIRFKMVPKEGKRYETGFSIEKEEYLNVVAKDKGKMVVAEHNGKRLEVDKSPFNFRVYQAGELIMSFNRRGYLYYESVKKGDRGPKFAQALLTVDAVSEDSKAAVNQTGSSIAELKQKISSKLGEESFGGNTDSKPNGATSLGFDLLFENTQHVFGIPEHSTAFNLKSTRGPEKQYDEPFRLYNVDIFEHLNDSPMAMYGSVPLMMGHKKGHTSAVLLLNSAEMWVDIERIKHADEKLKSTSSHWMVESGIVDLFLFVGPTQTNIFNAYTKLTGRPQLPQEFAIGHHSCRWNYNNEKDALQVDAGFDKHEIPYDVLWLDIEHTDGKRYFTFDNIKFPDPVGLQTKLANKGRKMVTIIDPHIKKDDNYYVSKKAAELDIFVKTKDATVLDGECWPGLDI